MEFWGYNHSSYKLITDKAIICIQNSIFRVDLSPNVNLRLSRNQRKHRTDRRSLSSKLRKATKSKFHKTADPSLRNYKIWTLNLSDRRKTEDAAFKFLRYIFG